MKDQLIKNYINKLNISDIEKFALNNNINLSNNETNVIYDIMKKNYKDILNGNYDTSFKILKNNLSNDNYEKVKNLFFKYKEKYQHLL